MNDIKVMEFCPFCGKKTVEQIENCIRCTSCSSVLYRNVACATAALLFFEDKLLLTRRAKDPSQGKLDLAGGFVDSHETAEEGLVRELKEELDLSIDQDKLVYWKSFPNVYHYKDVDYHTCDLVYEYQLEALPATFDKEELSDIELIALKDLNLDDVGLESIRRCLKERQKECL